LGYAILVHFIPKGETVNSQNDCDVLRTKLKPAIRSKGRGKLGFNLLKTQPKNFFSDGIKKKELVKCWNRCVEVEGDYVEK
jgi:hypothetical protein